jgi:hypothetical protein
MNHRTVEVVYAWYGRWQRIVVIIVTSAKDQEATFESHLFGSLDGGAHCPFFLGGVVLRIIDLVMKPDVLVNAGDSCRLFHVVSDAISLRDGVLVGPWSPGKAEGEEIGIRSDTWSYISFLDPQNGTTVESRITWIFEQTPSAANLVPTFENNIAQMWVPFL